MTALAVVFALSLASYAKAADTGTVTGKVTKDGAGVAGAKVMVVAPPTGNKAPAAAAPKGDKPKPVATATTEADGSFKMADVPAGDYIVRANLKGQGQARSKVSVKAGETVNVDLALKEGKAGGGKKGNKAAK